MPPRGAVSVHHKKQREEKRMLNQLIASGRTFESTTLRLINLAKKEILISTFRWECPDGKKSKPLDRLICSIGNARNRGVRIRVMLNRFDPKLRAGQENTKTAELLTRMKIEVRRQPDKICNHAKILITDQTNMITGSHNYTQSAFSCGWEISTLISGYPILNELVKAYEISWSQAMPYEV